MIESVKILPDGKILLNNCVIFWYDDNFKPQATFDRKLIKEMDVLSLIQEYVKTLG